MKNFMSGLLKKNMVAIDIGSYSIKIVEGSCNMNSVQIDRVTTVPTPSDAFYDGKFADANKDRKSVV